MDILASDPPPTPEAESPAVWGHSQYDWYQVSVIFALGLVFGTARALTNSTLLTIWLHCFVNILASIQIESVLQKIPVNN